MRGNIRGNIRGNPRCNIHGNLRGNIRGNIFLNFFFKKGSQSREQQPSALKGLQASIARLIQAAFGAPTPLKQSLSLSLYLSLSHTTSRQISM